MRKKILFRVLKIFLLLYALVGLAFYYFQKKIMLHPVSLSRDYVFKFSEPFEEIYIPLDKNDSLHLIRFLPQNKPARGAVIYWHGNTRNVERYAPFASHFTSRGYEVWMPDYPGFGKSTGDFDERKLYQIADQVMKLVHSRFSYDSIIVYGKSFGTGVAAYLSSYNPCRALLLETPYYSMHSLLRTYLFLYPVASMSEFELPVWSFLDDTRAPVTIFHGRNDGVIFYSDAGKLKKHLKKNDLFVTFPKGTHNDLDKDPLYLRVLDSILSR